MNYWITPGLDNKKQAKTKLMDLIKKGVCKYYHVPIADVMTISRKGEIIKAKHVAIFISLIDYKLILADVARYYKLNHASCINARTSIDNLLETDSLFSCELDAVRINIKRISQLGEFSNNAKLTGSIVKEIKTKYKPYVFTIRMLAKEYNISKSTIGKIVDGKYWIHVK